jgi:hypothetical protein
MTTRELLELASLDAMGLLDDHERAAFERAFRGAAPAVRRQVRREQERLTGDVSTLPDVEPPAELRGRVLETVRGAIVAARQDVVGQIVPENFSIRANVSPLWRAACIGFATATLVLLGVGYSMQSEYNQALAVGQSGEIAEIARELGPRFEQVLLSPTAERVAFASTASFTSGEPGAMSGGDLRAALYVDVETQTAFLVCRNLPALDGDEFRLVVVREDGLPSDVLTKFRYTGGLVGASIPVDVRLEQGRLGIVPVGGDSPIMMSI